MEPFEIMISESQERMLCVVEPGRLPELLEICERWEVRANAIGEVTDTEPAARARRRRAGGRHARGRAGGRLPALRPRARGARRAASTRTRRRGSTPDADAGRAPCSPCSARRTWPPSASPSSSTTRSSGSRTVRGRRRPTPRCSSSRRTAGSGAIAVSIDGNGRRVACDPYTGAVEAVLECARNLACVGAEPLGLTNCLNFGNPEKPHIAWQLTRAVEGLRGRLPGARRAGGGRQRVALQRGRGGPDLPHPDRGHGRDGCPIPSACRWRLRRGGPRDRARRARSRPALAGSELEKLRGPARRRPAGGGPGGAGRRRSPRCAPRCARAGCATVHDISEGGLAVRAGRVLHRGRDGRARGPAPLVRPRATTRHRPLRRGARAARVVAGPAAVVERLPGARVTRRGRAETPADRRVDRTSTWPRSSERFEGAIPAAFA